MKYSTAFLTALFCFFLFSCNKKDVNSIQPSSSVVKMEGEGGQTKITFTNKNWEIAKVVNQKSQGKIYGNIYSPDGDLIQKNHLLKLEGQGRLDASWTYKGFSIIRKSPTSIVVILKENFTKEDFNFTIVLESGNETRKITVMQKPSQGYKMKDIKYTVENADSDSIYFVRTAPGYSFSINASASVKVTVKPFSNIIRTSAFTSPEDGAFPWMVSDSSMVKIPARIEDNRIYYNGEQAPYAIKETYNDCKFKNKAVTVTSIPSGESEFFVNIEFRKRRLAYTLHLVSNRTGQDKIIKGQWTEIAPTGNYEIDWE